MDEQTTRVYHLARVLRNQPGFSYRPNGLFEYWGVPLTEIPVSVDLNDYALQDFCPVLDWNGPLYPETHAQASRIVRAVDEWMAERQVRIAGSDGDG